MPGNVLAEPLVHDALASMGVAGAIIFVLMTVIAGLLTANVLQWRHSNKVYGYRLQERDVLRDALNDSKHTLADVLKGMQDRNEITEELSDVIKGHTGAFMQLKAVIELHYDMMKQDKSRGEQVASAIGESLRTLTATVAGMHTDMMVANAEVKAALAAYKNPQRRGG